MHHSGAPADDAVTEILDPAGPAQAMQPDPVSAVPAAGR